MGTIKQQETTGNKSMINPTYLTPDQQIKNTIIITNDNTEMYYYINWSTGKSSVQFLGDSETTTNKNLYVKAF